MLVWWHAVGRGRVLQGLPHEWGQYVVNCIVFFSFGATTIGVSLKTAGG